MHNISARDNSFEAKELLRQIYFLFSSGQNRMYGERLLQNYVPRRNEELVQVQGGTGIGILAITRSNNFSISVWVSKDTRQNKKQQF